MSLDLLRTAGFEFLGDWQADEEGIKLSFAPVKGSATVYAFVVDDTLMYVGLTQRCFYNRMAGYRHGKASQVTNVRIRNLIRGALQNGSKVQVLAVSPSDALQWRGLPINVAVGLEAGLIDLLKPIWNMLNKRQKA